MREGDISNISTIVGRRDLVAFNAAPSVSSVKGSITGVVVDVDNLSDSSTIISLLAVSGSIVVEVDGRGERNCEGGAQVFVTGGTR